MQDDETRGAVALEVAGFWRRLIAAALDGILLGIVGLVAGTFFFDALAALNVYARLIGFTLALLYFGVLNSRIGGGQTLGKRLLGVRVVGGDGSLLSLPRSLLRYSVLGIPIFLNGAPIEVLEPTSPAAFLLSGVVFGGLLSIIYLYLFNRRTRRSLHDLASGSWVVRAEPFPGTLPDARIWRGHLVVVALIFIASFAIPVLAGRLLQHDMFRELSEAREVLLQEPGVRQARVNHGFSFGERSSEWLTAIVVVDEGQLVSDAALAKRLAAVIHDQYPDIDELERIVVVLTYGYDMGIASSWRSHTYRFDPSGSDPGPDG